MIIKSIGNPCGPCFGCKKSILLQTACLLIGLFEIYLGCIVFSASVGTFVGKKMNSGSEFYNSNYWDKKLWSKSWIWHSYGWQAICYCIFSLLGIILVMAYLKRRTRLCLAWIVLAVLNQIASIVGVFVMPDILHFYTFFVALMTIVRGYFVWVMIAFHREIILYPDGYPPAKVGILRNVGDMDSSAPAIDSQDGFEVVTIKSSVKYVGDG